MKECYFPIQLRLLCFFFLNLLIGSILSGCAWTGSGTQEFPTLEPMPPFDENFLIFPDWEKISVSSIDRHTFVTNLLGREYLSFRSRTDFYWFEIAANDVIPELNKRLPDGNWKLKSDWEYKSEQIVIISTWERGDLELSILMFDDLDSVGIDSLSRNYEISGPVPGSTMIVIHIIDKAAPLR